MSKTAVSQWDPVPDNNSDIDGINIAELCPPAGINNAIRTVMAQIATWYASLTTTIAGLMPKTGGTFTGDISSNVSARPIVVRIGAGSSAGISWQLGGNAGYDIVTDAGGNMSFNRSNIATGAYVNTPLFLSNGGSLAVAGPLAVAGALTRAGFTVYDNGNLGQATLLTILGYTPLNRAGDTMSGDLVTNVSARPVVVRIGAGSSAGISWQLGGKAGYDIAVDASGNMVFNRSNISTGAFIDTPLFLGNDGRAAFAGAVTAAGTVASPAFQLAAGVFFTTAGGRVYVNIGGVPVMSVDSTGTIRAAGPIIPSTTP